jgi:hypothetical protein
MEVNETIASIYKKWYCLKDNRTCARYMVFKKFGKEAVPIDLYPNMINRANKIISGKENDRMAT